MSDCAAPQKVLEFGQFGARVDAQDFASVVMMIDRNFLFLGTKYFSDVGQVIFALTIRRLHSLERREKLLGLKAINSGVDFPNLSLLVSGISLLDDFHKATVFIAHHPPIASGVLEADGKNR